MPLFEQVVHTDRQVQFPGRRKLTNVVTQEEKTVLVERNEGIVYNEGVLFDAANMNDLEERVSRAFDELEEKLAERVNLYYPVGKVYMSFSDTDPASLFPGTTWERLLNRVLLPVDPQTQTSGQTGGSDKVAVTPSGSVSASGNTGIHYTTIQELPSHTHSYTQRNPTSEAATLSIKSSAKNRDWSTTTFYTSGTYGNGVGSGHAHPLGIAGSSFSGTSTANINNMQAYVTVYAWRRLN